MESEVGVNEKLDQAVATAGLSFRELGQRAGVSAGTLSRAVNGRTGISLRVALRIARALNCSPGDIGLVKNGDGE